MKPFLALALAWLPLCYTGCSPAPVQSNQADAPGEAARQRHDVLTQFSLLSALAAGDYEGTVPLDEVLDHGDFGLGTFDRLDGEMIVLDGRIYQALPDAKVREADLRGTTPFAAVTFFEPEGEASGAAADSLDELNDWLSEKLSDHNRPYALRIDAEFAALTLRSVRSQTAPYRPLVEVVGQQSTWKHENLRGTMVGLRCPRWMGTLNVAGYHWHFISDDRTIGGHVLQTRFHDGTLRYDRCDAVDVRLPSSAVFDRLDLESIGRKEVDLIERQQAAE